MQLRAFDPNDQGSLAPLGIGLAMLSLAVVLAVLASGSLYLSERRLTTVAESTAIAVLIDARGDLNQSLFPIATSWLEKQTLSGLHQVELVEASSIDKQTVRIRLCSRSRPIFESYMFSETGKVCSEALARRGK